MEKSTQSKDFYPKKSILLSWKVYEKEIMYFSIIVYSKWSCAFLDLPSSECTKKSLFCFKNHLMRPQFPAVTPFSVGCFSGGTYRTYKIKTSIYGFNMLL